MMWVVTIIIMHADIINNLLNHIISIPLHDDMFGRKIK